GRGGDAETRPQATADDRSLTLVAMRSRRYATSYGGTRLRGFTLRRVSGRGTGPLRPASPDRVAVPGTAIDELTPPTLAALTRRVSMFNPRLFENSRPDGFPVLEIV